MSSIQLEGASSSPISRTSAKEALRPSPQDRQRTDGTHEALYQRYLNTDIGVSTRLVATTQCRDYQVMWPAGEWCTPQDSIFVGEQQVNNCVTASHNHKFEQPQHHPEPAEIDFGTLDSDAKHGSSSNFRELLNIVMKIEEMFAKGLIHEGVEIFVFADNIHAESAFYKGTAAAQFVKRRLQTSKQMTQQAA